MNAGGFITPDQKQPEPPKEPTADDQPKEPEKPLSDPPKLPDEQ